MSSSHTPPPPMLAQGAETAAGSPSRLPDTDPEAQRPPEVDPDQAVENILSLLSQERFQTARRRAAEAVAQFPDHRRVANVWRIFDNRSKATRRPATEPNRREEMAWLCSPPDSARGQWVALVGSKMVAKAETLPELAELLRSETRPKPVLVHRVDD